jgi:hypothetical protein
MALLSQAVTRWRRLKLSPRRFRVKINPYGLAAVSLVVMIWSDSVTRDVQGRRADLAQAKRAYATALTETRAQLASLMGRVTSDRTLAQNLDWKLSHSARSALASHLETAGLDAVTLVGEGCKPLARAGDAEVALPCPENLETGGAGKSGGFYWFAEASGPALGLARTLKLPDGRTAWALGAVRLGPDWLELRPDLRAAMTKLDLTIGESGGTVLLAEGLDKDGRHVASLSAHALVDRIFGAGRGESETPRNPLLWPCFVAAMLGVTAGALRARAARNREQRARSLFVDWCRGLGGKVPSPDTTNNEGSLAEARELVSTALDNERGRARTAAVRVRELEERLKERELMLSHQRQRVAAFAELDSLAEQMARTTSSFLGRMRELRASAESLVAVTTSDVKAPSQALTTRLGAWKEGIGRRGARKFFRTLSETPGSALDRTKLDDEVDETTRLAAAAAEGSEKALAVAGALAETASFAERIAGLWHGLVLPEDRHAPPTSLGTPIAEAQELVRLEATYAETPFANLFDPVATADLPPVSKSAWVTALYHVYVAFAELTAGSGASVATRARQDGDRRLIVVQAAGPHAARLPRRTERQAYHLEVARSVLAPFHVAVAALPTVDGPYPIVLSWRRSAALPAGETTTSSALSSSPARPGTLLTDR